MSHGEQVLAFSLLETSEALPGDSFVEYCDS